MLKSACKAIFTRFVQHHVEAVTVPVGEVGSLSGFKIESVSVGPLSRVAKHLIRADVERGVRVVAPRNTLKPECGTSLLSPLDLGLHIDMREKRSEAMPQSTRIFQVAPANVSSMASTDSGSLETGFVPSTTSPTAYAQPLNTCQRMSSTLSVGEFG